MSGGRCASSGPLTTHHSTTHQKNIRRFQIAVDDAARMGVVHRARQLLRQGSGFQRRQRCAVQFPVETAAVAKFQREEGQTVVFTHLIKLDDVRVLQPGDGLRLDTEAHFLLQGSVCPGEDHLESDESVRLRLPGLVDDTHAAVTQLAENFITGDRGGRMRFRGWNGRQSNRDPSPLRLGGGDGRRIHQRLRQGGGVVVARHPGSSARIIGTGQRETQCLYCDKRV